MANKTVARDRTLERVCDKAIIDTLKYRAIFEASLSKYQIGTFLLCHRKVDSRLFNQRLKNLVKSQKIKEKDGKYFLPGVKPLSWRLRAKYTKNNLRAVEFALHALKPIKWIKLLAVTGSTAAHHAKKKDDVDIFIVTEKNRLWLTRFFVVLLLKAHDKYRTDRFYSKKVCPNIYIDEDNLEWEKSRQNVYTAHEILMMQPIIAREYAYFKFLHENKWVFSFFGSWGVHFPKKFGGSTKYKSKILDFLEIVAMVFQLWYMRKKKTTEITSKSFIHFNKYDHTNRVLEEFRKLS